MSLDALCLQTVNPERALFMQVSKESWMMHDQEHLRRKSPQLGRSQGGADICTLFSVGLIPTAPPLL